MLFIYMYVCIFKHWFTDASFYFIKFSWKEGICFLVNSQYPFVAIFNRVNYSHSEIRTSFLILPKFQLFGSAGRSFNETKMLISSLFHKDKVNWQSWYSINSMDRHWGSWEGEIWSLMHPHFSVPYHLFLNS